MPDTSGPFDGSPWPEARWFAFATRWAPNGVLSAGDLRLVVTGLTATLQTGKAWVAGAGFERTAPVSGLSVPPNSHTSFSRRDRLVLRRSLTAHAITPTLLRGTPAANPAPLLPTANEAGDYDLLLWSFLVPPNSATTITGLIDERVVSTPRIIFVDAAEPKTAPEGAIWFQVL